MCEVFQESGVKKRIEERTSEKTSGDTFIDGTGNGRGASGKT